jgi:two-component system, response regulator PdtaR
VAEALQALGVPFVLASAYDQLDLVASVLVGACNVGKPTDEGRLLEALARAVGGA